jgi:hypothetical protein
MLFASLEGLFHRDHAVSKHSRLAQLGLRRGASGRQRRPSRPAVSGRGEGRSLHPITSPASLKTSRAMMSRWISLVPS